MSPALSLLLSDVQQILSDLARFDRFWDVMRVSFGTNFAQNQARALQHQWKEGDFSQIPTIELVDQDVLGSAFGGYASSTNKIYLSRDFVLHRDRSIVTQTLLEEIGHYVDFAINQQDSRGDEGRIFAKLSLGQNLSPQELTLLRSINDHASVSLAGVDVSIEQSSLILEDLLIHAPADLVSALLGSGVVTSAISYTGGLTAAGLFSGGLAAGIGIDSGVVLSTGSIINALGPNDLSTTSTAIDSAGDIDLDDIVGVGATRDASILEFSFIPSASIVSFSFVFASEEYPEFVDSVFNDVFAFFVNDVNIAIIPGTTTPVSINNVSPVTNSSFYISNEPSFADIEFDGFTTVLSAVASSLAPGIPATVKLAIADTADAIYDSAVFIQAGSFANPTLVTVTASDSFALEDTSLSSRSGEFIISRTGSTASPLSVSFSLSGSASSADFVEISKIVTIPGGQSSVVVNVNPIDDALLEGNETVILSLIDGTGYDLGLPSSATIVIEDNETQPVNITLAVGPANVVEDEGLPLVFTFTRSGSVSNPLTVNYNVGGSAKFNLDYVQSGASSFSGTSGSVVFASGSNTASVTVSPGQDLDVEPNETVALTLAAGTGYLVGTATAVTGFINDDDQSITLSVSPSSVAEDGSTNIVYTFVRTGVTTNTLTVNYTVNGSATFNSDYTQSGASSFTGISGTLNFAPGESVAVVAIDPTADLLLETDETISLALATGSGYTIATPGQVSATIIESPPPVITLELSPASVLENESNNLVYTFTRTGATTSALTVSYSVAGTASLGIDYTGIPDAPSTKSVTFAAGSATATVTVDPSGDNTGELNETVTLSLIEGLGYSIGTVSPVTGTIVNDDAIFSSAFDLVLLQDLSGSFGDDIAIVRTLIPNLISDVNSLQPNTPIGISSFVDKPVSPFGGGLDYVYRTDQSLTTDSATLQSIYDGLSILYGNDSPEAQLEALLQVAVRPLEIGFRAGTKRVVVLFTDASYHVAGDGASAGITTPNNLDAVLDGSPAGTGEDYPGVAQLGQKLIDANILPIFAVTSDQVSVYQDLLQNLSVPGSVVTLDSNSSNIKDAIRSGLANLFFVNITAPTSGLVTDENGGTATFSVELSIQPTADVTISLQLSDPTEGRLSTSSLIFTPANWNTPQLVAVTGIDDPESTALIDGDQTYIVTTDLVASADPNYNGLNPVDISVVNQDRDESIISLSVSPVSTPEDGRTDLIYTFMRSGDTTVALDVNYTVAGTAILGTDYTGISKKRTTKTISFAAGSSTATVSVNPKADTEVEADESVELSLVSGAGYTIGTSTPVVGTITNDDLPLITLAVSPKEVNEDGSSNLVYTFTRSGDFTSVLDVNYNVAGTAILGTDYTGIPRKRTTKTVTFASGSSTASVTVDPTLDTEIELDETVELTLASGTGYTIGTTTAVQSTIKNDDFPEITLALSPKAVTEDTASNLLFTFTRSGDNTAALDVYYSVGGTAILGTDYTGIARKRTTKTVSFAAGSSTATVTVDPTADTEIEADETVELSLVSGANYTIGTTIAVVGTISNDDFPFITLALSPNAVTEDGSSPLTYTFTRRGETSSELEVLYTVAGSAILGTDYTGIARKRTTKSVTFAAGAATATVTVDPTADTEIEGDETVELTLANGSGYTIGTTAAVVGTISNDDFPEITLALTPAVVTEDSGTPLIYTFTRSGATTSELEVLYNVGGTATLGTDYTGIARKRVTKSFTFTAGSTTASVMVEPTADIDIEAHETVEISLAMGSGYTIGTSQTVVSLILNDDVSSDQTYTLNVPESSLLLLGDDRIHGIGNELNNSIIGNSNNNRIIGLLGADRLTGGGSKDSDLFIYNSLSESLLGDGDDFDVITDFNSSDRIFVPLSVRSERLTSSLGKIGALTETSVASLLTATAFGADAVAAFTSTKQAGTLIAINDGRLGYQAESDAIILLENYNLSSKNFVDFV